MLRFLMRRLALAIMVCLTVLVVSFTLTRLSGDLAISIAGPNATPEDVEIIRKNYGFDRPVVVQFVPDLSHLPVFTMRVGDFAGRPVINLSSSPLTESALIIK